MRSLLALVGVCILSSSCGTPPSPAPPPAANSGTAATAQAGVHQPPAEWQTVADWASSGIKQTESFTVASREWRIYWKTKNEPFPGAGILQVSVHQADTDALVALVSNKQGAGSDVSYVRAAPGRYYLSINSANVQWLVRVEDQRAVTGPPAAPSEKVQKMTAELAAYVKTDAVKKKDIGAAGSEGPSGTVCRNACSEDEAHQKYQR